MIDVCTHSPFATSYTISWCTPGGYDFTIEPKKSELECSMWVQIWVVNSSAPWNSDVRTCWPDPDSSRRTSAARIPAGTRNIAAMLGRGTGRKIGPRRQPGCSHCCPLLACTSAS